MSHHDLVSGQLARDRAAAYTHEAVIRSLVRQRADRRPPPCRHSIDRRTRLLRHLRPAH